jgi:hypothetical protein
VATSVSKADCQLLKLPFTAATEFVESTAPYQIVDAWVVASATHANGTAQVVKGDTSSTTAITDAMACDTANARINCASLNLTNGSILAGGSISVKVASGATGTVYLLVQPLPLP